MEGFVPTCCGVIKKMLKNIIGCRKSFVKCFSTLPMQEIQNKNPTNSSLDDLKDEISNPLKHPDYFNVHDMFTVKDLFDARVHFGHKITSVNKKMAPFLFGSRLNHLIFDLNITADYLRKALNFAAHIAYQNGIIIFVSKNSSTTLLVEKTAAECKEYAVTRQWRLGIFTDSNNIFKNFVRLPDLCIILNTREENGYEHPAVMESAKMCIPTIAIVDSNCDPNLITYPVPGSDDSLPTVSLYCKLFKEAILRGKTKRQEHLKNKSIDSSDQVTKTDSEKVIDSVS